MQYIAPFRVAAVNSQTLAVTGTSQAITLAARNGNASVRILVTGTQMVYFKFDAAAVVANDTPMLPNTAETFFLEKDVTTLNFIAGAAGSTVIISYGESA